MEHRREFIGVVHGLEVFLPLIRQHGGEGHIVNTASIAGFQIGGHRRSGSYGAMKFAVVALSELIAHDLKDLPIGVSVLAPAAVKTRIYTSGENRPARFGGPYEEPGNNPFQNELDDGLEPDVVGERVVRAIRNREFYVFTHMHTRDWLLARHHRIIAAFDECEKWIAERATNEILLLPPDAVDRLPRRRRNGRRAMRRSCRSAARSCTTTISTPWRSPSNAASTGSAATSTISARTA